MIDNDKFSAALGTALQRERGLHGSVGTQNEKILHAALKNYYAPFADEQEIKIGSFFADAVCEDGIFEIQTRQLYKLKDKLREFLKHSRVTVVYPAPSALGTLYLNEESGELVKETPMRKINSLLKAFEELYSIREFLNDENLRIIIARLKIQKRVYFRGNFPNLSNRSAKKKLRVEKMPLEFSEEIILEGKTDYARFLPKNPLPELFTKKEFANAVGESASSLRPEVLRTVGIIEKVGKKGNSNLYKKVELYG
ncbi:MAG: hypothetical protein K2J77_11570 [Oscillospiraceae bacterium]|nr:hypothetical protein [Oscillospiraceae bacterium]